MDHKLHLQNNLSNTNRIHILLFYTEHSPRKNKRNFNKCTIIESICSMYYDHNEIKPDIKNRNITENLQTFGN